MGQRIKARTIEKLETLKMERVVLKNKWPFFRHSRPFQGSDFGSDSGRILCYRISGSVACRNRFIFIFSGTQFE